MAYRLMALILLAAWSYNAQAAINWHVDAEFTLAVKGINRIRVAVTVLDENKEPVESLTEENFRLDRFFCDSQTFGCLLKSIPVVRNVTHVENGLYFIAFDTEGSDLPISSYGTRSMLLRVLTRTKRGGSPDELKGRSFVTYSISKP